MHVLMLMIHRVFFGISLSLFIHVTSFVNSAILIHDRFASNNFINKTIESWDGGKSRKLATILHIHVETWPNLPHSYGVVGQHFLQQLVHSSIQRSSQVSQGTQLLITASSVTKYNEQWVSVSGLHTPSMYNTLANVPSAVITLPDDQEEYFLFYAPSAHNQTLSEWAVPPTAWESRESASPSPSQLQSLHKQYLSQLREKDSNLYSSHKINHDFDFRSRVICPDIILRFSFPFSFDIPTECESTRLYVHGTAEYGKLTPQHKSNKSMKWSDLRKFDRVKILTPSSWSLEGKQRVSNVKMEFVNISTAEPIVRDDSIGSSTQPNNTTTTRSRSLVLDARVV